MTDQEKKNKRTGLITSLGIHALLLLAFIFLGLTIDVPPKEEGMMINFGTSDTGLGQEESEPAPPSEQVEEVQEAVSQPQTVPQTAEPQIEEEVVTQESEEAIALRKQKQAEELAKAEEERKEKLRQQEEERKRAEEERIRQQKIAENNALFQKAQQGKGTGPGEGENQPGGNQGSQNGTPGAPHGLGGKGVGFQLDLGGRGVARPPKMEYLSDQQGAVVVDIWVDRTGKVVRAVPGARGSTTTSRSLYDSAESAAYSMEFTPKADADYQQKGTVTFVFKLQ